VEARSAQWRDVLRGPHVGRTRLVLQHLMALPLRVLNPPVPPYITPGDTRATAQIWRWRGVTEPVRSTGWVDTEGCVPNLRELEPARSVAAGGGRPAARGMSFGTTDTARRLTDRRGWSPSALPVEWLRGVSGNAFELCPERLFRVPHVKSLLHPEP